MRMGASGGLRSPLTRSGKPFFLSPEINPAEARDGFTGNSLKKQMTGLMSGSTDRRGDRQMARTAKDVLASLPKDRQTRIQKRSQELVAEYMALQELRKAMELTQKDVAEKLSISQDCH